jgi:hypothetical protein
MEESTSNVTVRSTGVRYGLILAFVGIIMFLIYMMAGIDMTGNIRFLSFPIYIVVIFLAHKYFKENGDGYMTFGQGVGISFWLGLVSSVISSIFTYFYVKVIDGSMIQQIMDKEIEKMQEKGMSDEQIDQTMKFVAFFTSAESILVIGTISIIIFMVVAGLIISIFTQKNRSETTF